MYAQVFDNLYKATESAIQVQQELFRTLANYRPLGRGPERVWAARAQAFQKKWVDTVGELLKKQQGSLETQMKAGQKLIEEAFDVTAAKDADEFRAKLIAYWQKSFDCLRQTAEAQLQTVQATVSKVAELAAEPELKAAAGGPV